MVIIQNIINSNYYYQPAWVMIIIVLSVIIMGYLYSAFNNRFQLFLKAVFITRFSMQASREERSLSHPVSLLLSLNFIFILSLFILQLSSSGVIFHSGIDFSFASFIIFSIIIFSVYFVKILFLGVVGFILDKRELLAEYIFTIFLVTQFLGILFIPVVLFIAYGPSAFITGFIYLGCALLTAAFITRTGKGIRSALLNGNGRMFYIILYLCTFEILPLLIGFMLIQKLVR